MNTPGTLTIRAWLAGNLTTAELDACLSDSEALRHLRDTYTEELIDRYDALLRSPFLIATIDLTPAIASRFARIEWPAPTWFARCGTWHADEVTSS